MLRTGISSSTTAIAASEHVLLRNVKPMLIFIFPLIDLQLVLTRCFTVSMFTLSVVFFYLSSDMRADKPPGRTQHWHLRALSWGMSRPRRLLQSANPPHLATLEIFL